MKKSLLLLFAALLPLVASAAKVEIDGIWYNLVPKARQAEVISSDGTEYSGSITIPATITFIGAKYSVTSIGDYAFAWCDSLTTITIPEGVTSIGTRAFEFCNNLTSITIPENSQLTSIGDIAFSSCSSLTTITIPEGVTSIGEGAFSGCSSLTAITVASKNSAYDSRNNCNAIIETKSNTLIAGCSSTVIPEGVTSIGTGAFAYCESLTAITLPESVTSIGKSAFCGCGLTTITIPAGVTSIGTYAFCGCSLTTITIPAGVTSIAEGAFQSCWSLTAINIPEGVTSFGKQIFWRCSSLTAITIPASVTSIGEDAFDGCSSLERVTINCVNVGSWFSGLSSIKEIVLGESVRSIEQGAFSGCSSLESLHIAPNVDSYGDKVFEGCTIIKELTVMGSVMPEIPSENLTSITLYSPIPLETKEFAAMVYRNATLNIPESSLTRYQNADVWKNFWYVNEFDPKKGKDIYLTINQADNGYVKQHLTEGTVCTFTIVAAEGWTIHSVTFNGEEVTDQLTEEGTFTTPALQADAVLNIAYEKTENNTMVANTTASRFKVQGHRGTLRITGTTQGEAISVYTTGGTLVAQESAEGDETLITIPTGQVYIVTVADKVVKIGM